MTLKQPKEESIQKRIEQIISSKDDILEGAYTKSLEQLVEELRVYHVELEFQNDELKRIQQELEKSRDDYQGLFNQAPIGFLVLGENLSIISFNDFFRKMALGKWEGTTNSDFRRFVHPEEQDRFHHFYQKILKTGLPDQIELKLIDDSGSREVFVNIFAAFRKDHSHELLLAIADITDRILTSKALEESEYKFRTITDNMHDMVLMSDLGGKICFVSPSCAEFGFVEKDLMGQSLFSFVHPDDLPHVAEVFRKAVASRQDDSVEFRSLVGSGGYQWVEVSGSIVEDTESTEEKAVFVVRDIEDRKSMQKALEKNERMFRSLFENNHAMMLVIEPKSLQIINANQAACKFYGYSKEQLCKMKISDINTLPLARIKNEAEKAVAARQIQFIFQHRLADGSIRDVEVFSGLVEQEGKSLLYSIIHDISKRKKAEQQLKESAEELRLMNATKDKLFSVIAHDLRSPIGSMMKLAEILYERGETMTFEDARKIEKILYQSAGNTYHLLENLLEWSRLQRGLIMPTLKSTRIKALIEQVTGQVKEQADKKKVQFYLKMEENLEASTDDNLLQIILRNLLSNAIKFSYPDSMIGIKAMKSHDELQLQVIDHGTGMEKEVLDNLFKIEVNTGRQVTLGEKSVGLGLIICNDFLKLLNGKLSFMSAVGQGTTATITLKI